MNDRAFLDTNILVYALDRSDPTRKQIAEQLVFDALESRNGVVSVQVLKEFYVVATRKVKVPLSTAEAVKAIDDFTAFEVVDDTLPLFRSALQIQRDAKISLWDACIVSAAAAANCDALFTEDLSDRQVISGVRITNPFV